MSDETQNPTEPDDDTSPGDHPESFVSHQFQETALDAPWERGRSVHWLFEHPTTITGWMFEHASGMRVRRILIGNVIVAEDEAVDAHLADRMTYHLVEPGALLAVEFLTLPGVNFVRLRPTGLQSIRRDTEPPSPPVDVVSSPDFTAVQAEPGWMEDETQAAPPVDVEPE